MVETIYRLAAEHGVVKESRGKGGVCLKAEIARAIDKRGELYRRAKQCERDPVRTLASWAEYHEANLV